MDNTNINGISKSLETLFFKGDFQQAIDLIVANKKSLDPGLFHYNLGTLYSKLEDFGAGRYHLEMSLKNGYEPTKALNNIEYIKAQIPFIDISTSYSFEDKALSLLDSFPMEAYLALSLIIFFLFWVGIKFFSKISLQKVIVSLCISLSPMLFYATVLEKVEHAVVIKETEIKEGPSGIFDARGSLAAGIKILISETRDKYYFIKAPLAHAGWIKKDDILKLK